MRPSTQGCTELTCLYHGKINELKQQGFLRTDWEPGDDETELDRAQALADGAYL